MLQDYTYSVTQSESMNTCMLYLEVFLVILQRSNYTVQSSLSTKAMLGRERKSDEVGMQTV